MDHAGCEGAINGQMAGKMICGRCAKEQNFSNSSCISCGSDMGRGKSAAATFWSAGGAFGYCARGPGAPAPPPPPPLNPTSARFVVGFFVVSLTTVRFLHNIRALVIAVRGRVTFKPHIVIACLLFTPVVCVRFGG
jgi:hypothetical protein